MRFRRLVKWVNPAGSSGLLYFAQLTEEMTFDYTIDTYKASVMHTGTLCSEAKRTIHEIENGNIKAPNINHVAQELAECYLKDPVAKELMKLPADSFLPTLWNPKSKPNEIKPIVEILAVNLSLNEYKKKNEELLISEIEGAADISKIRTLARSYVTTLLSKGYSQEFIFNSIVEFFYTGPGQISGPQAIRDFIALFPNDNKTYEVVFQATKIFSETKAACSALKVATSQAFPTALPKEIAPSFQLKSKDMIYALATDIEAHDIFSAREMGERKLALIATLMTLYHHKESPVWSNDCIVFDKTKNESKIISNSINPMQKCYDLIQSVASKKLDLLLDGFALEKNSFQKFIRSAQLHSLALRSESEENQILNLWISIESLIPSESKSEDSATIEHIVDSIVPFLNVTYIEGLIQNLVKDLLRWDDNITRKAFRKVDGRKFSDRLVKILVLPEYSANLAVIETKLKDFHLLRDRIDYFKQVLSKPENMVSVLDAHKKRLEWQIRRIYRVRNIIVHTGKTPAYTKQLIEHAHNYLDRILSELVKAASKPRVVISVSQGFKYTELKYKSYYDALKVKGLVFDKSNIDSLIFPNSN